MPGLVLYEQVLRVLVVKDIVLNGQLSPPLQSTVHSRTDHLVISNPHSSGDSTLMSILYCYFLRRRVDRPAVYIRIQRS